MVKENLPNEGLAPQMDTPEPSLEYHGNTAFSFIHGDYLNTYTGAISRLHHGENPQTIQLDTFSERYPNISFGGMPFSVNDQEQAIISELDALTAEAQKLLKAATFDLAAFGRIAKQVAHLCRRSDIFEDFTRFFGE